MGPVKGGSLSNLLKDIQIPKMFRAEQSFKKDRIEPEQIPGVNSFPDRKSAPGSSRE